MKIKLDASSLDIGLGNNGVVLKISDNAGKHRGNLRIGQATVEWMKGKTRVGNGVKLSVEDLIARIES